MQDDLISQLRDIHLPTPIGVLPLAIGWYFIIAILLSFIAVGIYFFLQNLKKRQLKNLILCRLDELQNSPSEKNVSEELSTLLRRVVLVVYPRHEVAGLHGEAWLQFLDKTSVSKDFTNGPGRLLVVSPYQDHGEIPEQLFHLIKNWVKKNL